MIRISTSGNFDNTTKFLKFVKEKSQYRNLDKYGQIGVRALSGATPVDTGKTAASWYYEIADKNGKITIQWKNSNMIGQTPIVVLIQYGHATKNGHYVQGRDFINPAIQPIFDEIAENVWKEVQGA